MEKPSVAEQGDKDNTFPQEGPAGFRSAGRVVDGDGFLTGYDGEPHSCGSLATVYQAVIHGLRLELSQLLRKQPL